MTFEELLSRIKTINHEELRTSREDYLEMVFAKEYWPPLDEALISYFGEPLKPKGKRPCKASERYAASYGGIRSDQTLYVTDGGADPALALLWPWGSGSEVTLKIIRITP